MKATTAPLSRAFSWRTNVLPIANLLSFIATCIVNSLGSVGAFGKGTVAAISDRNPTEVVPAGYAFSIWGLIYALQALMILCQLPLVCLGQYPKNIASILSISSSSSKATSSNASTASSSNVSVVENSQYNKYDQSSFRLLLGKLLSVNIGGQNELYDRMGLWYTFANITNLVWIIIFVFEFFWASFAVIALLSFLVLCAYISIGIDYGKRGQSRRVKNELYTAHSTLGTIEKRTRKLYTWEYWIIQAPFSIYLGWLTAATLLNLFLAVKNSTPSGTTWGNEIYWSVAAQLAATICAGALSWLRCDFIYSGTVAWALLGIFVKHRDDQGSEVVKTASICCFVISLVVAVASLLTAAYAKLRRMFKTIVWAQSAKSSVQQGSENVAQKAQHAIVGFIGTWIFELNSKKRGSSSGASGSDSSSESSDEDNKASPRYQQTLPV